MSMIKTQESYSAFRMPRKDLLSSEFSYANGSNIISPIALAVDDISREELTELQIFDEFLASHVQQNEICTVQCMLLWSEWIRAFRRQAHGFPKLIREQEFKKVVLDTFGVAVADEGFRGRVFEGLQYIP